MMAYSMVGVVLISRLPLTRACHLTGSYVKPGPDTNLGKTSNIYAQTRSAGFGLEVQKRILLGTYSLSAE
jgi:Asp-tRNA(Asn)/Glu-tRNA(Gln) amidotransferase A subunit family amidase